MPIFRTRNRSGMETRHIALLGAAGGLGRAIAEALLTQGDRVWLLDLASQRPALEALQGRWPGQASVLPLDLRDPASIAAAFRVIAAESACLDACINAAGVIHRASFESRSEEHTSELQSRPHLVCRLLLEKKNSIFFRMSVWARMSVLRRSYSSASSGLLVGSTVF